MGLYVHLTLGLILLPATVIGLSSDHISNVTLHIDPPHPVELGKDNVTLTCSALGSNVSYSWTLRGIQLPIYPRYHLTSDHSTLIISPVSKNDFGPFACIATNHLNNETSMPLNLSWTPTQDLQCGVNIEKGPYKFYCSWLGGQPSAIIHMFYKKLNVTGMDEVHHFPSYVNHGSELTCVAIHGNKKKSCVLELDIPYFHGFLNTKRVMLPYGDFLTLAVSVSGRNPWRRPLPAEFEWEAPSSYSSISTTDSSLLHVDFMREDNVGLYQCSVSNIMGSTYFTVQVDLIRQEGICTNLLSPGAIAGIVFAFVLPIILNVIILCWYRQKKNLPVTNTNLQENTNVVADTLQQVPDIRRDDF